MIVQSSSARHNSPCFPLGTVTQILTPPHAGQKNLRPGIVPTLRVIVKFGRQSEL